MSGRSWKPTAEFVVVLGTSWWWHWRATSGQLERQTDRQTDSTTESIKEVPPARKLAQSTNRDTPASLELWASCSKRERERENNIRPAATKFHANLQVDYFFSLLLQLARLWLRTGQMMSGRLSSAGNWRFKLFHIHLGPHLFRVEHFCPLFFPMKTAS